MQKSYIIIIKNYSSSIIHVIVSIGHIHRLKVLAVFIDIYYVIVAIVYNCRIRNYCLHDYPFGLGS